MATAWDTRTRTGDDHTTIGDLITEIANQMALDAMSSGLGHGLIERSDEPLCDSLYSLYVSLTEDITRKICDALVGDYGQFYEDGSV